MDAGGDPSESEINDNIVAYWRPKQGLLGRHRGPRYAYRQFWCWSPPARPPLSEVTDSFSGHGADGTPRRFMVEFAGDVFADPQRTADMKPSLSASPGTVVAVRTYLSRAAKTFRVVFEIDLGSETLSELRLVLESAGKPVSETWLYRWTQ